MAKRPKRRVPIDFETAAIERRPAYPPRPVGVSIAEPGRRTEYLAWGHPVGNNSTEADARRRLAKLWRDPDVELEFHNGKFDVDVGETHLGLPALPWERYHDTLFLAFLVDPYSPSLSLKPLAERYLGIPSEERDAVRDWILANVHDARRGDWGAYISRAPGGLVGKYAIGDADRTGRLFRKLHAEVSKRSMLHAYDRERKLMPILLEAERGGIYVNVPKLRAGLKKYEAVLADLDARVRRRLRAPELDLDKKEDLADALEAAGVMESWTLTKTGKRSTAKGALLDGLGDRKLLTLLLYRGALATCLRTFMRPWYEEALVTGGRIHTNWNQVRQSHREGPADAGARTGRLSSNPNFQNIPTKSSANYERLIKLLKAEKLLDRLAPFPMVRSYLAPDPGGEVFLNRDYSQQELRILGHYEAGVLAERYVADPWLDLHEFARQLINEMLGTDFERKPIKNTGFGLIYGMGLDKLAASMDRDLATAKTIRDAYLAIFPGLKKLNDELKWSAKLNNPIRTWGGREYFVEPPRVIGNRLRSFEYKLLNTLIQGSAADNTKEAIIAYHEHPKRRARFLLTVHDEFLASTAAKLVKPQMAVLREAMESVKFDVPMLSEGSYGTDWANLRDYDSKGRIL